MKKLLYLFGLIILIVGCQNKPKEISKPKCQLRYVEQDTVYDKIDSTNMIIYNIIHDYSGSHKNCSYNVLFRLDNQFQSKIITDSVVF